MPKDEPEYVISQHPDGHFIVLKENEKGFTQYEVRKVKTGWVCNCPDFRIRRSPTNPCKHVRMVLERGAWN